MLTETLAWSLVSFVAGSIIGGFGYALLREVRQNARRKIALQSAAVMIGAGLLLAALSRPPAAPPAAPRD